MQSGGVGGCSFRQLSPVTRDSDVAEATRPEKSSYS